MPGQTCFDQFQIDQYGIMVNVTGRAPVPVFIVRHDAHSLAAVQNGSVVTWQHINLHGEYDFSDEKLQDSVGLRVPKILELSVV